MGNASLVLAAQLSLLILIPNSFSGRMWWGGPVAGNILIIGIILKRFGMSTERGRA